MSSKTKIVVLRMKEIIYTAIFVGLGILLITLFLIMFRPKKDTVPTSGEVATYVPGVYSSAITLNNQDVNVQPAMDTLSEQIVKNQSTKNISYSDETRYTSTVLLKAVDTALTKAEIAK